jgi:hypothetical protein
MFEFNGNAIKVIGGAHTGKSSMVQLLFRSVMGAVKTIKPSAWAIIFDNETPVEKWVELNEQIGVDLVIINHSIVSVDEVIDIIETEGRKRGAQPSMIIMDGQAPSLQIIATVSRGYKKATFIHVENVLIPEKDNG